MAQSISEFLSPHRRERELQLQLPQLRSVSGDTLWSHGHTRAYRIHWRNCESWTPGKRAWAVRHGYDFHCERTFPKDVHPSWHKLSLIIDALLRYERVVWLDADSIITNPLISADQLHSAEDGFTASEDWSPHDTSPCFSAGNIVATKAALPALLQAQTLTHWSNRNPWDQGALRELQASYTFVAFAPCRTLNAVPFDAQPQAKQEAYWQPGDFLAHLTGISNDRRLELLPRFVTAGLMTLVPRLPRAFDLGWSMDYHHLAWLSAILESGAFASTLEIGCYEGVSSSCFTQSLRSGKIKDAHFCDLVFRDSFRGVIGDLPCELHQMPSASLLARGEHYDLVLIDGDHSLCGVEAEWLQLEQHPPKMIVAHDVCASLAGHPLCSGANYLWHQLQADGWLCLVDARKRRGQLTERGFLVATKDPALYEIARRAYCMTCL
jgi:galactosyl transferase GMA12/MNN10 family